MKSIELLMLQTFLLTRTLSQLVMTQNRELSFSCIADNIHGLTNGTIVTRFLQRRQKTNFIFTSYSRQYDSIEETYVEKKRGAYGAF